MLGIKCFTCNPFSQNSYLVFDNQQQAILFDVGFSSPEEWQSLNHFLEEKNITIQHIFLTHAHIDHILGLKKICIDTQLTPLLHFSEKVIFESSVNAAHLFGLDYSPYAEEFIYVHPKEKTISTSMGDVLLFHTPGHSPGSVCFYFPTEKILIAGDVLFNLSIGRTDLPGGNYDALISSIKDILFQLPNETKVYSGHGEVTYIGYEKEYNPFLKN